MYIFMMCQRIGMPADLDHRLGTDRAFLADPRAESAGKNHHLHIVARCLVGFMFV